ncbi:MAG: PIG-L deacetylase family protein, partial [Gemmatimonadota bacterium]
MTRTLLVALAHPDDEVGAVGTILSQLEVGDRVFLLWLTRGEMTQAFGSIDPEEVAARREALGAEAAARLGVEHRFLDFPDTRVQATPAAAAAVAKVLAEVRPDGVLTWGRAWVRGVRHPDHQACGKIVRDAITLARIAKAVEPLEPHRAWCPVFTFRDVHSSLPPVAVDVEAHLDTIHELAAFYREAVGFGDREWLERRLVRAGSPFDLAHAEVFDAWES